MVVSDLKLARSQDSCRLWRHGCGLAKGMVPPTPPDVRNSSPFSNGRINAHYNPKGKIYHMYVSSKTRISLYICFHAERRGDKPEGMIGQLTG